MAIFLDGPVSPADLTTFVREVPVAADLTFLNSFPTKNLTTNTVDFAEIIKTNRTARFRSFDGRIHVSARDSGSDKRVKLPALSSSKGVGEYERLQLEFARTSGTNMEALAQAVYNDAESLTQEVQNRLELAWGDVLTDGILTINEEGYQGEADFGVPANQKVAPAILWSTTATATALSDYIAWCDVYAATNGSVPAVARTSQRVLRLLQSNAQIVGAVHGSTSGKTRVNLNELNELFESEGVPTISAIRNKVLDVDGVATTVLADDKILFTPEDLGDLGYTAWGVSATALELVGSNVADISFEEAAGIVGVIEKVGPPYRQFTFVDAVAMPILEQPKLLMIADVA
jgi:hypothetical protein